MNSELYGAGKTRGESASMILDPSRAQPSRAAKTSASAKITSDSMKRTRRPKGTKVEANLEAHLNEIVQMEEANGISTVHVPKKKPMAIKVAHPIPHYIMDKTTYRTPRKDKHQPYYVMEETREGSDEEIPRRLTRRTLFLYEQLIQELQTKMKIHSVPKKLPIHKVTQALEILDELKLNILEPILLINPHKERLNLISNLLATPIQNTHSPQEKQRIVSIYKQFKSHGIDAAYLGQLNRLLQQLNNKYDINEDTDIYGLYEEYKNRIQRVYVRITSHIENLIARVTEWRLTKLQQVGDYNDRISSPNVTKDQKKQYALILSQLNDSLNLYTEYQNKCLTLMEHYEEEGRKFMTQHIDIYVKHDLQNRVNIFETQEIMAHLMNLRNLLETFLTSVQEAKQHTTTTEKEVNNALDDILAMFGTKMFGGKKRSTKK